MLREARLKNRVLGNRNLQQRQHLSEERRDVYWLERGAFVAGIDHELANDFRTARCYFSDLPQLIESQLSFRELRFRKFGEGQRSAK